MGSVRIMVSYDGEWVKSTESGIFRFDGSKAKGMLVPKNITYQGLLDQLYSLIDFDRNELSIAMKFLYASSVPVAPAEIVSDEDTSFFIAENSGDASLRTPLCVTLVRKDLQEESSQTFDAVAPEENEHEEALDVGTTSGKLANDPDFVAPAADPIEWVTTKEALSAKFTSSASVPNSEDMQERQLFPSKKDLQEKLSVLAIKKNFEFRVQKSSPEVLVVACVDEKCQWRLRACRFRDNTSFQIRKFVSSHTCSTESRHNEHRQASSWVISQLIKSKYKGTNRSCKPKDIIEDVRKELGVTLSYEKAWRAREIALNSDGVPRRRRLTVRSSGEPKRQRTWTPKEDHRIRRCKKCGEAGHFSKTCSVPIIILPPSDGISGGIIQEEAEEEEEDRAVQEDKGAESQVVLEVS